MRIRTLAGPPLHREILADTCRALLVAEAVGAVPVDDAADDVVSMAAPVHEHTT